MSNAVIDHPLPRPHSYTSEFAELLTRIKDEGLLARSRTYYITLIVILSLSLLATLTGMYFLGNTWIQIALAPVMAVIMTQFSFVTHEAAHRQVFSSGKANETPRESSRTRSSASVTPGGWANTLAITPTPTR